MNRPSSGKLRVVLADDHRIMLEGLRMLLATQTDMEVVGEADDGRGAVTLAAQLHPDVVVIDVSMPNMSGVQATEEICAASARTRVVALTRHTEGGYLQRLLEAGASGYVLKQSESEELLRAIRTVARGMKYLDPAITTQAMDDASRRRNSISFFRQKPLSAREEQVLRSVAWGLLTREIADQLGVSAKTVETHKANAMNKLGLKSRIEIVRYAVLQGWLQEL